MLIRNITILAFGAGIAQVLTFAVLPLLTRLFEPSEFAVLTVFVTLVSASLPFVCGKYETAIVVAQTEHQARDLAALCIWISGALSLGLICAAVVFERPFNNWIGCPQLGGWLAVAPVVVWLGAVTAVCAHLANRRAAFGWIASSTILQAIAAASVGLLMGLSDMGAVGLLAANLVSVALSTGLLVTLTRSDLSRWYDLRREGLWEIAHRYRDFPLYNASSSILNAVALALPVFCLSRLCDSDTVGLFGLAVRVGWAPLSLLSSAVSQVHLNRVSELVKSGHGVAPYVMRVLAALLGIALLPTLLMLGWGPNLFAMAFGPSWRGAGEYLAILMPAIALQFVASTLSPTCCATGNNRLAAAWKVLAFLITAAFFLFIAPGRDARVILRLFAVTNGLLYLSYLVVIIYSARHPVARSHETQLALNASSL